MAYNLPGAGSTIVVTANYIDDENNIAKREFYVPFNSDLPTTLSAAASLLDLLKPLTSAALQSGSISLDLTDDTPTPPQPNHPVSANAMLSLKLDTNFAGNPNFQTVGLPAPIDALFLPTSPNSDTVVDVTYGDLVTLITAFQTGGVYTFKQGQVEIPHSVKGIKRYRKGK